MTELYPTIRLLHIAAVAMSGGLFFVRGLGVAGGAAWAMAAPLRYLSYAIDTVLLGAAVTLATLLHRVPLADRWLTTKVALVVLYVVLGSLALKRAPSARARRLCLVAALATFGAIFLVARSRGAAWWAGAGLP